MTQTIECPFWCTGTCEEYQNDHGHRTREHARYIERGTEPLVSLAQDVEQVTSTDTITHPARIDLYVANDLHQLTATEARQLADRLTRAADLLHAHEIQPGHPPR